MPTSLKRSHQCGTIRLAKAEERDGAAVYERKCQRSHDSLQDLRDFGTGCLSVLSLSSRVLAAHLETRGTAALPQRVHTLRLSEVAALRNNLGLPVHEYVHQHGWIHRFRELFRNRSYARVRPVKLPKASVTELEDRKFQRREERIL